MKKSVRMPYKVLSLFMALLIISVSVPFASAAETLKSSNVTQYPTITYKNADGKMYFGQTESEALTINDDEIVTDSNGNQVAGYFTFKDPDKMPTDGTNRKLNLTFVPDNPDEYTSFNKMFSPVTYDVEATIPVYVDEVNDPLVASEVEAGALLSTSTLSGGKMTNPYNPEEPKILARTWAWVNPDTVVNESGYYEAHFIPAGYTITTAQVYVKIAGEIPETTISEMPTIETFAYDASLTWKDVEIKGGAAALKVEGTAVEGTFAVAEQYINNVPTVGSYNIPVTFTPADPEAALPYTFDVPVTVTKGVMRFVDENGNEIVPEITVPYGTKFNDVPRLLEKYVKGPDVIRVSVGDLEKEVCTEGTFTCRVLAPNDSANYETTELTFKVVIEKKKLNPALKSQTGKLYIEDNTSIYRPKGTFTLEYTIDGVAQEPITGIKYNTPFDWNPTKSGTYVYTVIYNEAEVDEYFIIDDFTTSNPVRLTWAFSATGTLDGEYRYGDEVKLEAPATDPAKADKPFYGFVEWVDVNGNTGLSEEELENKEISFTMPDGDVDLDATYRFDLCLFVRFIYQKVADWLTSFFQSIGTLF